MSAPAPGACVGCGLKAVRVCDKCLQVVCANCEAERARHHCTADAGECNECYEAFASTALRTCGVCDEEVCSDCESDHEDYCDRWS